MRSTEDSHAACRRLLLIAYAFPPAGGVLVQRALAMARHLPAHGFEVTVLTARNPAVASRDEGLLSRIPPSVQVVRVFTPEPPFRLRQWFWRRLKAGSPGGGCEVSATRPGWKQQAAGLVQRLFSPEPEVWWVPFGLRAARRLHRQRNFHAVVVTCPPFSLFLIGNALKREFPELMLTSDFRDAWIGFYTERLDYHTSDPARKRAKHIEAETVQLSDLVTTATVSWRDMMRGRYTEEDPAKIVCIPNGYEPDEIGPLAAQDAPRKPKDRVVLAHFGTLFGHATPKHLLDAMESLPAALRARCELHFAGRITEDQQSLLENRGVTIRKLGFLSHAEAMQRMRESDILLVLNTDPHCQTGKVFEYLAAGRPIVALTPPGGEVERILLDTGAGRCANPWDQKAAATLLQSAIEDALGGAPFSPDVERIRRYERPRLIAGLAELLHQKLETGRQRTSRGDS